MLKGLAFLMVLGLFLGSVNAASDNIFMEVSQYVVILTGYDIGVDHFE